MGPDQLDSDFPFFQNLGKMYMSWTDTSLCESGFVFDRAGSSFTPTYDFESPNVCFTKHSPSSIFDDLTVSKVQPGTNLTYCIRATNDVGYDYGYRSDPACQWTIVAWEASVCLLIHPSSAYIVQLANTM